MQLSNDPVSFTSELNPLKRAMSKGGGSLKSFFGKLGKGLMQNQQGEEEEADLSSFLGRARTQKPSAPMYDPRAMYGGLYSMYGGRRVRGGLLGD